MKKFLMIVLAALSLMFVLPLAIFVILAKKSKMHLEDMEILDEDGNLDTSLNLTKKKKVRHADLDKLDKLSERQRRVYRFIKRGGESDMARISEKFTEVTQRTLRRDLTKLVSTNLVTKEGDTKGALYKAK